MGANLRRIIPVETSPEVIAELCSYDQGKTDNLQERSLRVLDMITMPKNPDDDTSTALGCVAVIADQLPMTCVPKEHVTFSSVLVRTSRSFFAQDPYPGVKAPVPRYEPDGVYTLIPAAA